MSYAISELLRFQNERGLTNQPFILERELTNILEEIIETKGLDSEKARRRAEVLAKEIDRLGDDVCEIAMVDAFADIIVFAIGSINKLGYNAESVLLEVGKEINSRTGTMVDGKFIKDKSSLAMKLWYKADLAKCKFDTKDSNDWCHKETNT